jgi:sirohydrochlorin cobaltochelatase
MEEAPFVAQWAELTTAPHVVVVPFFIADGLHSYQDIPVLLGMESEPTAAASQNEVFRHNPHDLHGRKLYYSNAIGTEPLLAEVILDQVRDFDAKHPETTQARNTAGPTPPPPPFPHEPFILGQVSGTPHGDRAWRLRHADDANLTTPLTTFTDPIAARDIATLDAAGNFRPLKSAPNLKRGWQLNLADDTALRAALDFLYPAALGFMEAARAGTIDPVTLRETLGRQTGMYRFTNTITDTQAQDIIADTCDASKCLRCITWRLDETHGAVSKVPPALDNELPILCVEACTFVVSAARTAAQKSAKEKEAKEHQ